VPGPELPSWGRFQKFVGIIVKVLEEEADKEGRKEQSEKDANLGIRKRQKR
jgi:hypothetical protein